MILHFQKEINLIIYIIEKNLNLTLIIHLDKILIKYEFSKIMFL
jgi:hypothetical protein